MSMTANEIETMIKESIPDSTVVIEDLRGDGDHYSAHVKSSLFNGKSKIQQHQMVYKALKGKMGQQLHALALKTSSDD
jgi:stress-induced morphogen